MENGRTIPVEMDEYKELMMLKGKFISLQEYVTKSKFIDKEVVLAILGIYVNKEDEK